MPFVRLEKAWEGKPAGEQLHVSAEQAELLVKAQWATRVEDDPLRDVITGAIGKATDRMTAAISNSVEGLLKSVGDRLAGSRKNAVPAIFGPAGNGDPKKSFGAYLLAVRTNDREALKAFGSSYESVEGKATDLTGQSGPLGGYTIPEEFSARFMELMTEASTVEPRATIEELSGRIKYVPTLDHTGTPSTSGDGDSAFFGGYLGYWTEEGAALTQDEPGWKRVKLELHKYAAYTVESNELEDDRGAGLESSLMNIFVSAAAWGADYSFLFGNGAGKPLGINVSPAVISATRSAASAFALADAAAMLSRLVPGWSMRSTAWWCHPYHLANLVKMVASSTGGPLVWMPDGVTGAPRMFLFGMPVVLSDKMKGVNVAGDVILADCSKYLVARKRGGAAPLLSFSEHVKYLTDQGVWKVVLRRDGQPWMSSSVKLSDGSSTVSPFVNLAAG